MSVIRKLSKAIHLPNGDRRGSRDTSPAGSPKLSPSSPHRKSIAALFLDKESVSSSEDFSDLDYGDGTMSKNAQKRQARKKERESRSRLSLEHQEESEERMKAKLDEASKHETEEMKARYGPLPLMQSTERSGEERIKFENITSEMIGKEIVFRARLHHVRRMGPKLVFFIFRQQINTMQGVLNEIPGISSLLMLHWAEHLERGSILRVKGTVQRPESPVKSASQHELELKISEMKLIVRRADPGERQS
jgi:ergosteryl-3beta-O-L-aspartate synthase